MTKIITILTIALFSIGVNAQDAKVVKKEAAKKESCCSKKATEAKKMTAADIEKCKAKCKAAGKTCNMDVPRKGKVSCCAKA
ncbi:hypothetical protein IR010_09435 [Flavobacterium sp. MR2016-29]|uniref:hypothetical protein n=1 Tax=Flavobacterium sp. MR2016-29 TaxID=2783795 RepID=UPI00188D89D3|nr:hypothetical protein [Flavobacterium sp. MR2016-29]MBF4492762.1 hypothetical protein [Flavobacterium sp. MR2016-29]